MQWLASKYSGMGFKDSDVRRHGACLFAATVETYGQLPAKGTSHNLPGTFLDIPAATTMRALAHPSLINRFLKCAPPVPRVHAHVQVTLFPFLSCSTQVACSLLTVLRS